VEKQVTRGQHLVAKNSSPTNAYLLRGRHVGGTLSSGKVCVVEFVSRAWASFSGAVKMCVSASSVPRVVLSRKTTFERSRTQDGDGEQDNVSQGEWSILQLHFEIYTCHFSSSQAPARAVVPRAVEVWRLIFIPSVRHDPRPGWLAGRICIRHPASVLGFGCVLVPLATSACSPSLLQQLTLAVFSFGFECFPPHPSIPLHPSSPISHINSSSSSSSPHLFSHHTILSSISRPPRSRTPHTLLSRPPANTLARASALP